MKTSSFAFPFTLLGSSLLFAILAAACSGGDDEATVSKDAGKDGSTVVADDDSDSGLTGSYTIGGSITGLTADGLILKNNGGDDISVASGSTSFSFTTQVANGGEYSVTVSTQPTGLSCSVANASGTVSSADVTDVAITCSAASVNTWTWINGSNAVNAASSYGTLGVAAATNTPGSRYATASWIGADNVRWFFGGSSANGITTVNNDMWKFDGTNWTWVNGANTANASGTYGVKGTAAANNVPGARYFPTSWKDSTGKMWLHGGRGRDASGTSGYLDDTWRFDGTQWTWIAGGSTVNAAANYGTKGVSAGTNTPGGRYRSVGTSDTTGGAWLFGGIDNAAGYRSDLWQFDGTNWKWVTGPNTTNQKGTYGTKGTGDVANTPGARQDAVAWIDNQGAFWIFGGYGYDSAGTLGGLGDFWKFANGMWTWVGGSNLVNPVANYGALGTAAATNDPGARENPTGWVDAMGRLWMFGGTAGHDVKELNDVWMFDGTNWTWVSGSNMADVLGTYGTVGVAAASGPGGRDVATVWADSTGAVWIFGGWGLGSAGTANNLGDLWKYQP